MTYCSVSCLINRAVRLLSYTPQSVTATSRQQIGKSAISLVTGYFKFREPAGFFFQATAV